MQFDMHYYGTYAMAYAAGLDPADAQVVATAAQFVDDNDFTALHKLPSGEAVLGVATAHHPVQAGERALQGGSDDDTRLVWVPFHFLPGNAGGGFEQRLVCQRNSPLAQEMMRYYTEPATVDAHREHALHLVGIACHVYADTFSHHGFAGIASHVNDVDPHTIEVDPGHSESIRGYLGDKAAAFFEKFGARIAGAVHLGHGAVATYPDRPYLHWRYEAPSGRVTRDNPAAFAQACAALHAHLCRFRTAYYTTPRSERVPYAQVEEDVAEILATEADANGRVRAWTDALRDGRLGAPIQPHAYSETEWTAALLQMQTLSAGPGNGVVGSHAYHFFAAADYHRNYVLKRLLPGAGLYVA